MPTDDRSPWYAPNHRRADIACQRQPGVEVRRLHHADGRVQTCEVRDDSQVGAGWDVLLLEGEELLLSRRCADECSARAVALALEEDTRRAGWTAAAMR
jgi:hypothetical protein